MMSPKTSYTSSLSPEYAFLGLLSQGEAHGYELHQRLVEQLGQIWHISLSQTYNILKRLESKGFIRGAVQEQDKLPDRKRFQLTPSGRERFEVWLHRPSRNSVRAIRVEFATRLFFAYTRGPELAAQLIHKQDAETRAGLTGLEDSLQSIPADQVFNRLGLELRIHQLRSVLEWLADCQRVLLDNHTAARTSREEAGRAS